MAFRSHVTCIIRLCDLDRLHHGLPELFFCLVFLSFSTAFAAVERTVACVHRLTLIFRRHRSMEDDYLVMRIEKDEGNGDIRVLAYINICWVSAW